MTISSSMNAGVAGLNANATRLATIADNIANSATYGYKRSVAEFAALVIDGPGPGAFAAGGVRASTSRMVDQRGSLVSSANPTDLAIEGRGFLPVTALTAVDAELRPLSLVTTGSFRPDANGILRTETGQVLMGWPANADGSMGLFPREAASGLQPIRIPTNQLVGNPTTRMALGVNLPASATAAGADGTPIDMSVEYFGNLGEAERLTFTFTPTVPGIGSSNAWTVEIRDSASGGAVIGEYELTFDSSAASGGTLASVTVVSGGAYNPATGEIALTTGAGPLALSVGTIGGRGGLSQFAAAFQPTAITKNGSPVANLSSIEVDAQGNLNAIYDTGFSRRLYQIPVVDVANPNGLAAENGQAFRVTNESGAFLLWDAGTGPTGRIQGYSREESATDVAGELTRLIQTQRAYSSNAKVIQTVDEMLQETTNIKR